MGVLLRRHLTPIRDLFQWLHLTSITVLALVDKDIVPTLGLWGHQQPWGAPIWWQAESTSLQHGCCRSLEKRKLRGFQTAAFQNLRGDYYQEARTRLFTVLPETPSRCLSRACGVKSCLGTTDGWSPTEPAAHLYCRWMLYSWISLYSCIASYNLSHTFQAFGKFCLSVIWQ